MEAVSEAALNRTTSLALSPVVDVIDGAAMAETRDIAAFFNKSHKSVLVAVRTALARRPDLLGRKIVPMFDTVGIGNGATREAMAYRLDRDAFSLIVMGFTGERAFQWKLDYIEAFNRMEATLRQPQAQPFDPNDPAALRSLLIGYSEQLLLARAETAEVKQELTVVQAVVEEQRPMVDAYLAFLDDDGLCNLRTAARAVDAPCMLFLKWMEERKYLIRENGGELQPAAAMRRGGYMKLRAKPDANGKLRNQAVVTRSGLVWQRHRWLAGPGKVLALQAAVAARQAELPGI